MDVLNAFGKFGLSGIVIGALFISLWFLIKEIKSMNESNERRIDSANESHSKERESWLATYKDNTEVLQRIFERLK